MQDLLAAASVPGLVRLLRLNDDKTVVATLAGMTGGSGSYERIVSGGRSYIVVIARKSSGSPPGLRQQLAEGSDDDWMLQYSTAFFFDADGKLVGKLGGGIAADGINGDDVWLMDLGTPDRWFAMITRFEKQPPYTYQTEVCLIEPGFPTAFVVHHFPNSTSWTDGRSSSGNFFMYFGLPNGTKMPIDATGVGRDGKNYVPKFLWDSTRETFAAPAQLTYRGQPCFQIDLERSTRLIAIDGGNTENESQ
jgi:hypothetical protein